MVFLDQLDVFRLCNAVLKPLFAGHYFINWSPFTSPFFHPFATYFKMTFVSFSEQLSALLKLDLRYIMELFELKKFHTLFPQLVSIPHKFSKELKILLPLELLEFICENYKTKYNKVSDGGLRLEAFKIFKVCFTLLHLIQDKNLNILWKSSHPKESIADIVLQQRTVICSKLRRLSEDFTIVEESKNEPANANDGQRDQLRLAHRRHMAYLARRIH
jgi:hypothetical protein